MPGLGWDGGGNRRKKIPKPKHSPEALTMGFQRKASSYRRGCDPRDEVLLQGARRGERPRAASPLPRGRTQGCSRCNGRARSLQQPGPGTLVESRPEHQMAHQRAISATGLLLVAALIASSRLSGSQTDFYSLPGKFFKLFFFNHSNFYARHRLQIWLERYRSSFHQVPWI